MKKWYVGLPKSHEVESSSYRHELLILTVKVAFFSHITTPSNFSQISYSEEPNDTLVEEWVVWRGNQAHIVADVGSRASFLRAYGFCCAVCAA